MPGNSGHIMLQPDWDRWHELLAIRDGPGLTEAERAEYLEFLLLVARADAEEARVGNAAVKRLVARHWDRIRALRSCVRDGR